MTACLRPALIGIVVGVLAVIAVSPAHSHHLQYAIEDDRPGWNPDGVTLVGINQPWIIDGQPYDLCYEWGPNLGPVLAAIADWETVLPQTEFTPGCGEANPLYIRSFSVVGVPPECTAGSAGCAWWEKHEDTERGGRYTGAGTFVWVNDDDEAYTFTDEGLRATVAHELGHVFGLHEAYLHDADYSLESLACNPPPVYSIMDMLDIVVQDSTRYVLDGCDGALLWPPRHIAGR